MPDPTHPTVQPSDPVSLELLSAKRHLRQARVLAQQQQDTAMACARITLALDAVQDAIDYRSES